MLSDIHQKIKALETELNQIYGEEDCILKKAERSISIL
jgi:hypothetical protein